MSKILQYTTVRSNDPLQFDGEINEKIDNGWQPFGSVSTVLTYTNQVGSPSKEGTPRIVFIQAMVKYDAI